jgi:hypothetical protein
MPLSRLFALVLVFLSSCAFGQQLSNQGQLPSNLQWDDFWERPSTPSEAWRILPNSNQTPGSTVDKPFPFIVPDQIAVEAPSSLCYTIRSFVVARNRKDSDATHFVRSSTCQPAAQYTVKSIELHAIQSTTEASNDSLRDRH